MILFSGSSIRKKQILTKTIPYIYPAIFLKLQMFFGYEVENKLTSLDVRYISVMLGSRHAVFSLSEVLANGIIEGPTRKM